MKAQCVIVDIDGTLSKVGDRVKCLEQEPKDWDLYFDRCFEDDPHDDICKLVRLLSAGYQIVYCSGRRESTRWSTEAWFGMYDLPHGRILLRKDGDHRHDVYVKPELIADAGIELGDIAFVLEDRNSMVEKWREMGVRCLQVAAGDF